MRSDIMAMCWLRLSASARPRRARAVRPCLERLDERVVLSVILNPAVIPTAKISNTAHVWTPDPIQPTGLYHTSTNLLIEAQGFYGQMVAGTGASLTAGQRAEGNMNEIFQATTLHNYPVAQQEQFFEDFQREDDAIQLAMTETRGVNPNQPLTETTYLAVQQTLENNPTLLELAVQGHGLNDPPARRYYGYTNDFQNNTDNSTYYVGPGLDTGETAVPNFVDDAVMSHLPFPTVWAGGAAWQLNQNSDPEDPLDVTVAAFDDIRYGPALTAADFSQSPTTAYSQYSSPSLSLVDNTAINVNQTPAVQNGEIQTLYGLASATITTTAHTWAADPTTGLYTTQSDLATEWTTAYSEALAGQTLTPRLQLEAQAEAILENVDQNFTPTQVTQFRQDAQRVIDAIDYAMQQDDILSPLTAQSYLKIEQTIQNNPTLEELATQGLGVYQSPAVRYSGLANEFATTLQYSDGTSATSLETQLRYVGGGPDYGTAANVFLTDMLGHVSEPTAWQNGMFIQIGQNGASADSVAKSIDLVNQGMSLPAFTTSDFSQPVFLSNGVLTILPDPGSGLQDIYVMQSGSNIEVITNTSAGVTYFYDVPASEVQSVQYHGQIASGLQGVVIDADVTATVYDGYGTTTLWNFAGNTTFVTGNGSDSVAVMGGTVTTESLARRG